MLLPEEVLWYGMVWYGTIWSTDCDMVWWYHSSFESLATTMVCKVGGCGGVVCMSCIVMLVVSGGMVWK